MKYLVTISEEAEDAHIEKIEATGGKILYRSMLMPLLILEHNNIEKVRQLNFIEDIEFGYVGSLASKKTINILPHIDFSNLQSYFKYTNTKVAILDSGINSGNNNIIESIDYTGKQENGVTHGTIVSNIINQITPNIQILSAKITDSYEIENFENVFKALEWAYVRGARVINLSFRLYQLDEFGKRIRCKGECKLCKLVNELQKLGVLVVTAAGNDGPAIATIGCPGNSSAALTVGAINLNGNVADFSSRGRAGQNKPDLVTSGYISFNDKQKTLRFGTSFSTPIMTGVAAGLLELFADIDNLKGLINRNTTKLGPGYEAYDQGNGVFDINKMVEELKFYEKIVGGN